MLSRRCPGRLLPANACRVRSQIFRRIAVRNPVACSGRVSFVFASFVCLHVMDRTLQQPLLPEKPRGLFFRLIDAKPWTWSWPYLVIGALMLLARTSPFLEQHTFGQAAFLVVEKIAVVSAIEAGDSWWGDRPKPWMRNVLVGVFLLILQIVVESACDLIPPAIPDDHWAWTWAGRTTSEKWPLPALVCFLLWFKRRTLATE
ncbi:hypothetical protein pclt_cds_95 [Pandoravirus celtis]|uniref:Uncharacterized protein n=1 Tax=Pandoravirus celtis TaxID=2568002 RepID=A0A4D6EFV9_9VIRU|nr:hypothetical protein pclt_cds_95 [Pandoravirus celtis]